MKMFVVQCFQNEMILVIRDRNNSIFVAQMLIFFLCSDLNKSVFLCVNCRRIYKYIFSTPMNQIINSTVKSQHFNRSIKNIRICDTLWGSSRQFDSLLELNKNHSDRRKSFSIKSWNFKMEGERFSFGSNYLSWIWQRMDWWYPFDL